MNMMKLLAVTAIFFFFALAFADNDLHFKGSVSCLDCASNADLSGIQVSVRCDKVKKLAVAYTKEDGTFETKLPCNECEPRSSKCEAKIMGGPYQLYTSLTETSIASITENGDDVKGAGNILAYNKPLNFYKSCPTMVKGTKPCAAKDMGRLYASSKTYNLPIPSEWGLAPTSYYVPFIPIIGIP